MNQKINIGIDVSKNSFDVFVHETKLYKKFNMTSDDIKNAVQWFSEQNPTKVVLESTGGYERTLVAEMVSAELPVVISNPKHIRDFAKATGKLAKTDSIDAAIIAHFSAALDPEVRALLTDQQKKLSALTSRRRQLVAARAAEKNHKEQAYLLEIKNSINNVIQKLTDEIISIEKMIAKIISSDPNMKQKIDQLTSVPGIGIKTAALLISDLPELGSINRKQIASLIGIAPINRDSGQLRGKRITGFGRRHIRTALFMPMLSIVRFNETLKKFYQKLLAVGKAKMVAIVAVMRKLVTILNSMLKNNQPWRYESV